MYCNILVTKPFDHTFTYKIRNDQNVKLGNIVSVSFGKKKVRVKRVRVSDFYAS